MICEVAAPQDRTWDYLFMSWKHGNQQKGRRASSRSGSPDVILRRERVSEGVWSSAPTLSVTQRFIHPICSDRWRVFHCSNSSGFKHQHPSVSRTLEMNLTRIEWSLSGIHLVNFQGGRQAEFKSSKLVDDKLILLSVSLPWGDQNKRWNGSWEESGERRKSKSCECERKQEGKSAEREQIKMWTCFFLTGRWTSEEMWLIDLIQAASPWRPRVSYLQRCVIRVRLRVTLTPGRPPSKNEHWIKTRCRLRWQTCASVTKMKRSKKKIQGWFQQLQFKNSSNQRNPQI